MQRVPGYPIQNGSNYEITFYVDYPGGGTMSLQVLLLIISEQLDSIATNTQLTLRLLTTVTTPIPPQINITDNIRANALSVVLKDFNATEVSFKVKHYNTGKKIIAINRPHANYFSRLNLRKCARYASKIIRKHTQDIVFTSCKYELFARFEQNVSLASE